LIKRDNQIESYFNQIIHWFKETYQDKEKIIIGYNKNWKTGVNLGAETNRKFYQIPYSILLKKSNIWNENKGN